MVWSGALGRGGGWSGAAGGGLGSLWGERKL